MSARYDGRPGATVGRNGEKEAARESEKWRDPFSRANRARRSTKRAIFPLQSLRAKCRVSLFIARSLIRLKRTSVDDPRASWREGPSLGQRDEQLLLILPSRIVSREKHRSTSQDATLAVTAADR